MNYIHSAQQAQEEAFKRGISNQFAQQQAFQQTTGYAQIPPPPMPPIGLIAMTENAHAAFQQLSNVLSDLQERLSPIVESFPEPGCAGLQANQISEASAVTAVRILVERIENKTAEIHRLIAALRV